MKILVVSSHNGQTIELTLHPSTQILELKKQVAFKIEMPPNLLELLVFGEIIIDDDLNPQTLSLNNEDMITVQIKNMNAQTPNQDEIEDDE